MVGRASAMGTQHTPVTSPVGPALLDKSMKDSDGGRNDTVSHNLINLLFSPLYFPPRLPDVSVPTQLWRQPDPILCFLLGEWEGGASGRHCTFIELVNLHQNRGQPLIPPAGSGQEMGSGQLLTSLETRSLWTRAAIPTPSTQDLEGDGKRIKTPRGTCEGELWEASMECGVRVARDKTDY